MPFTPNAIDNRLLYRLKEAARQVELERTEGPDSGPNPNPFLTTWAWTITGIPGRTTIAPLPTYPITVGLPLGGIGDLWQSRTTGPVYQAGSGSAVVMQMDNSGNFTPLEIFTLSGSSVVITQQIITVWNWASTAIPANTMLKCRLENGIWLIDNAACETG